MSNKLHAYFKLMRPHQYLKNLLIFAPAFFAGEIFNSNVLTNSFCAFVVFCVAASGIYVFNDYVDRETDRQHPKKKDRPIASGIVSSKEAILFSLGLSILAISMAVFMSIEYLALIAGYIAINIAYSRALKHFALIDVFVIAVGFVMRLFAGHIVTDINLSEWIVIMTFLLALFMALAKRRDDLILYENTGKTIRKSAEGYSISFLDSTISCVLSIIVVAYITYTTTAGLGSINKSPYLYLTSVFVIGGLLRYLQLTIVLHKSGSPTRVLLSDRPIQMLVVAWALVFAALIY